MTVTRRNLINFAGAMSVFSLAPTSLLATRAASKFLILVELVGANDGLNTVIPYGSKLYGRLRPSLAVETKNLLKLDNHIGLHPALKNIARIYDAGDCKIVQGLGYPHPNLSHFRSIELWERGGDGKSDGGKGWLIEPLEVLARDLSLDAKAMFLDGAGDIFAGGMNGYLSASDLQMIMSTESKDDSISVLASSNSLVSELVQSRDENREILNGIKAKLQGVSGYQLQSGNLEKQMDTVCNLIERGLNIPVFKVSLGSFDTHEDQYWDHKKLLEELDSGIEVAARRLQQFGVWDDTIIMTYSEFGRRAKENGSRGTDHGMAAPHFVIGGGIKGGIYGDYPQLGLLEKDNLQFSLDYRSIYNFVLSEHFGLQKNPFNSYNFDTLI